jgi:hypothetical protein
MFHLAIPVAIIVAVKAYFALHGLSIGMAAMKAGYRAHKNGGDVIDAAISAGATEAAARLLQDSLRRVC